MQAAIKVGLYPSNDVISWTDSLGVAFQATLGLVSCTPTEGQSHLRAFFFFSDYSFIFSGLWPIITQLLHHTVLEQQLTRPPGSQKGFGRIKAHVDK